MEATGPFRFLINSQIYFRYVETKPFWRKRRYLVVLMGFFGFFNVYSLRVNLSVAIVAMTEPKNVTENGTIIDVGHADSISV